MKIDNVFIFCSYRDIAVLNISIPKIIECIDARTFTIICDGKDKKKLHFFKKYNVKILTDQEILREKIKFLNVRNKKLYDWYKQQIVKFEICLKGNPNEISLLWDGDTIPLKKMNFFYRERLIYIKSPEYYEPYFNSIKKLIGLSKRNNFSFIAQCFVLKNIWIKLLIQIIEKRSKKNYISAIIDLINKDKDCAFSEYETIGSFIYKYFYSELQPTTMFWTRYGYSLFRHPKNVNKLSSKLSFVSFEWWDKKNFIISTLMKVNFYFFNLLFGLLNK